MIEGERIALARSAILAGEAVAQKDVESREGRRARMIDIGLQRHDRRQAHLERRRADDGVILSDDVDAIEEDRFQGVLP